MDSKLQIISGMFRGRKLHLPDGARPTQNRARIALFNMLDGIIGARDTLNVWDAFAGSGEFGIEFLSRRPMANVTFTDNAAASIKTVRANVAPLNVGARANILMADAMTRIEQIAPNADLIFVDPPYDLSEIGARFVRRVGVAARVGTILVWEQDADKSMLPDGAQWEILRDKTYGRARFLILQRRA